MRRWQGPSNHRPDLNEYRSTSDTLTHIAVTMIDRQQLDNLQHRLGYRFQQPALVSQAFCHRSFVNEQPGASASYERLEFLGDAVLNLVVSDMLMTNYDDFREGELTKHRAALVNDSRLADISTRLNLGPLIQLGKGESLAGGHEKESILADVLEALFAAVYLDGGYQAAGRVIRDLFQPLMPRSASPVDESDFKSRLQEWTQKQAMERPVYQVVDEQGPDHDKTFEVSVAALGITARGTGTTKKKAEQDAARKALLQLDTEDAPKKP